jgi:hypothetical protein
MAAEMLRQSEIESIAIKASGGTYAPHIDKQYFPQLIRMHVWRDCRIELAPDDSAAVLKRVLEMQAAAIEGRPVVQLDAKILAFPGTTNRRTN